MDANGVTTPVRDTKSTGRDEASITDLMIETGYEVAHSLLPLGTRPPHGTISPGDLEQLVAAVYRAMALVAGVK